MKARKIWCSKSINISMRKKRLQTEADAANKIESSQPETQIIQTDTSIFKAE